VTPALQLATGCVSAGAHRITVTNEPTPVPGPRFILIRSATSSVWAVRADVAPDIAAELDALAATEPPIADLETAPIHAARYKALLGEHVGGGPSFGFPDAIDDPGETCIVDDERALETNFRGWLPGEIAGGCAPVIAVIVDGAPASICFCARRTDAAAEAGVNTGERYRGRGLAGRVTAAWGRAMRDSGRVPIYSTAWTNHASRAVARKLGLVASACTWTIDGSRAITR